MNDRVSSDVPTLTEDELYEIESLASEGLGRSLVKFQIGRMKGLSKVDGELFESSFSTGEMIARIGVSRATMSAAKQGRIGAIKVLDAQSTTDEKEHPEEHSPGRIFAIVRRIQQDDGEYLLQTEQNGGRCVWLSGRDDEGRRTLTLIEGIDPYVPSRG